MAKTYFHTQTYITESHKTKDDEGLYLLPSQLLVGLAMFIE